MKLVFSALLAMLLLGGVLTAQTSTAPAKEEATVKFINSSGVTLRFSIDGRAGPTVPSGDQGFDTTTVGNHTLKAETLNGKQSVTHTAYVKSGGVTWEVTPPKK